MSSTVSERVALFLYTCDYCLMLRAKLRMMYFAEKF